METVRRFWLVPRTHWPAICWCSLRVCRDCQLSWRYSSKICFIYYSTEIVRRFWPVPRTHWRAICWCSLPRSPGRRTESSQSHQIINSNNGCRSTDLGTVIRSQLLESVLYILYLCKSISFNVQDCKTIPPKFTCTFHCHWIVMRSSKTWQKSCPKSEQWLMLVYNCKDTAFSSVFAIFCIV